MAITNGYSTLIKLRDRLLDMRTYTASTISFSGSRISDAAYGLKGLQDGDVIQVDGSDNNDGYYVVANGNEPGYVIVGEALTAESAGNSITLIQSQDQIDDAKLESIIEGISREIDKKFKRRFFVTSGDETRVFTAKYSDIMYPGDIVSITTLKGDTNGDGTYNETWAATDYALWPANAVLDSEPYTCIITKTLGTKVFPVGIINGVQIVGKFGWPAVPPQIEELTLLLASRLFYRKDAIFGVVKGAPELGEVRRIITDDPEAQALMMGMMDKGKLV